MPGGPADNDDMDWPVRSPAEMTTGTISVRPYASADAAELFSSLRDERVWEHIPRAIPADAASALTAVSGQGHNQRQLRERAATTVSWLSRILQPPPLKIVRRMARSEGGARAAGRWRGPPQRPSQL